MSTKRKSPGRTVPPNLNRSISADPKSKSGYNRSLSSGSNGKNTPSSNGNTDPRLNDPAIQAKIGNRQTKTVEKTIGN